MTTIDLDFEDIFDDQREPEPEVQRLVIAKGEDGELILWASGQDAEREISESGNHDPGNFDIDEPPGLGLWVWEGIVHYRSWGPSYEGEYDCEVTWRGTFRAPTEDEWRAIRLGIRPWPEWDPQECADCGASTAPGTPDPHVCEPCVMTTVLVDGDGRVLEGPRTDVVPRLWPKGIGISYEEADDGCGNVELIPVPGKP